MSPVLDDVKAAFDRVPVRPRAIAIDRRGVVLPKGGHFQGIQRLGSRLVIPSSSDTQAYFVLCDLPSARVVGGPVSVAPAPLKHAGGSQVVDTFMAVGVEDDVARTRSEIQFWNLGPNPPARVMSLTIPRRGAAKVSTAGATGILTRQKSATLAVATWDADTIDFYECAGDPFRGIAPQRFTLRTTWRKADADRSDWLDRNFGAYQNVNLLGQRDGRMFLAGFHRDGSDDWMDLYELNLANPPARMLRKIGKKHMICSNGCSFRAGAGLFVKSRADFEVWAVNGLSGDHATGTTIHANQF